MPRTLDELDKAVAALEAMVKKLVTQDQLNKAVTSVAVEVTKIKTDLAVIPATPASLAQIASKLDTITGQLAPLSTHAGKILAVQAGSMGVR